MTKSNKMKIAVTGSGGQLGLELVRQLEVLSKRDLFDEASACKKHLCSDNSLWAGNSVQTNNALSAYSGSEIYAFSRKECNIADATQVNSCFYDQNFDIIFNCAAMTDVDGCESASEKAFAINAQGTMNLAHIAKTSGAKLVHVSTDYVFDGQANKAYCEEDKTDPQCVYGKSKLVGEKAVRENCTRHFIVRTAWLYGIDGKNFPKTIMRIAKEQGNIKVVNDQYGNPTYVKDLARAMLLLAAGESFGTYHCANSGICSWFDFAAVLLDRAGIQCSKEACSSQEYARLAKRPMYSALNSKKLEDTIGQKMRTWQEALDDFMCSKNELG